MASLIVTEPVVIVSRSFQNTAKDKTNHLLVSQSMFPLMPFMNFSRENTLPMSAGLKSFGLRAKDP